MSSHHFVKEQQEPALLILKTEGVDFEQIASLLEWSPTVLVAQDAVEAVISWGIKLDVVLADLDFQAKNSHLLEEQYPMKFRTLVHGDFLNEGIQYLKETEHSAVNVVGFDHKDVFGLESLLENLDIVIIDGPIRYFPIKNGTFRKWYPEGSLQLHAPENMLLEMKTGETTAFIKINHATFVEVEEGFSSFQAKGIFWIGEFMVG
ncbi:thiamine pyrophosphokinase [Rhodonellum sp.]|uniref:thiamine pyrophosphokinase n=1 Tax=Rhodonellum sp. TaxID=2231180 RepID=UPI00271E431C|nr:thiamine pyrophosphokinase [Rhodonellum sp.]MDO9552686.1 thiamine pyrophosphokinase [Rhodonellum sp.]